MENRQRTTDILFLGDVENENKCKIILARYSMYEEARGYIVNGKDAITVIRYMNEDIAKDVYDLLTLSLRDDKNQLIKIFPNYQGTEDFINNQDSYHRSLFPEMHVPVTSRNNGIVRNYYTEPPRFNIPMSNYHTTSMVQEYHPTVSRIGTSNIPSLLDLSVPVPDGLSSDRQSRRYRDTRPHNSYSPYSNTRQLQDRYHRNSERNELRYGAVGNNSSRSGASNDPVYGTSTVHTINRNRTRSGTNSNTDNNKDTRGSYK